MMLILEDCLYRFLKEERRFYIVNDPNMLSMIRVFLKRLRHLMQNCKLLKFMKNWIKVIHGSENIQVEERSIVPITKAMLDIRERGWCRGDTLDEVIERLEKLSKWHEKRKS